jgi:hypothetical protein
MFKEAVSLQIINQNIERSNTMSKRKYDDEPFNPNCAGCGPKSDPCVCQLEFDFMSDPVPELLGSPGAPESGSEFDLSPASTNPESESNLEARRQYMEELDGIVCRTLLSIVRSGKATPGHLNVARQYLKDKGFTLPELAKRERVAEDTELLGDLDLRFGNA